MSNSLLTEAISVPNLMKYEEGKLGDVHLYSMCSLSVFHEFYFSYPDTLTAATANVPIKFCTDEVTGLDAISFGVHFGGIVLRNVGQHLVSGTQSFESHSFVPTPHEGSEPKEENAEKLPNPCPRCR
jgi:hypothetical protein